MMPDAYACNPSNYAINPFYCEVGDLSNKNGGVDISGDVAHTWNDPYMPSDLSGLSIVFHGGSARRFCAKLQPQYDYTATPVARVDPPSTITSLKAYSSVFEVDMTATSIAVAVNLTDFDTAMLPAGCDLSAGLSYHIHTAWTHVGVDAAVGPDFCGSTYTGTSTF
jgi:hypothetical protein